MRSTYTALTADDDDFDGDMDGDEDGRGDEDYDKNSLFTPATLN